MTTTAAKILGARIKSARLRKGLSQEALADLIGSSRRNVMRWEGGHNEPRLSAIQSIAEATGQPLEFFAQEAVASSEEITVQTLARVLLDALHGAKSENVKRYADRRQYHVPVISDRRRVAS